MCGTHNSQFIMQQLNRCRYGVIKIPDRDRAGIQAEQGWNLKRAVTLKVSLEYKDIDEMLRHSENLPLFKEYMCYCIDYIQKGQHRGFNCGSYETTMI